MTAARYNTARAFEDQCEHAAQPSSDDGENRAMAIEELISERLQQAPQWIRAEFNAARQGSIELSDPRCADLPEWIREALMLVHVPDLRTAARDSLDDDEIAQRTAEIAECQEAQ